MKLFDTHAHLNFPDYDSDYKDVWERAKKEGLVGLINVGIDLATSKRGVELSHELGLFAAVGIHPNNATQFAGSEDWKRLVEEMVKDAKVVAIGETGFDFYRQFTEKDAQQLLLDYFLDLAERTDKAVLFHCRDAYAELLTLLKKRKRIRGVIHAFGGDWETAKKFLDLGLYLSFTAQVTYSKNQEFYSQLISTLPLDRILLETDCPFLSPEGLRGQRNEPRHVDIVAETIAKFVGKSPEEVAEKTTENAVSLFDLGEWLQRASRE